MSVLWLGQAQLAVLGGVTGACCGGDKYICSARGRDRDILLLQQVHP